MKRTEENKAICCAFFESVGANETEKYLVLIADDVVWWIQGGGEGTFLRGKAAVAELIAGVTEKLAGKLVFTFGNATAEDDRVALEARSKAALRSGKQYDNSYHFLLTVRDGLIVECKEYVDTKHVSEVLE